jgi:CMP-2-keto-3-deoxyoctulosonic acid synthetase
MQKIAMIPARYAATRFPAKLMQFSNATTRIKNIVNLLAQYKLRYERK